MSTQPKTLAEIENDQLRMDIERLKILLDAPPYVDCLCTGCPRKVPQAWQSGLCGPCADEDCEHTDGAMAIAAERDELLRQVEALEKDNKRMREVLHRIRIGPG